MDCSAMWICSQLPAFSVIERGSSSREMHHLPSAMESVAIPNVGLLPYKRPAIARSSFKLCKWGHWCQSSTLGLQLSSLARSRSAATSGLEAHSEFSNENEFMKLPTDGAWDSIMCHLRSRALRSTSPETSLREGHWVKLICGASFEDLAEVRNLSLVYTLAGVDCIDCAADTAVVAAVVEGVYAAKDVLKNVEIRRPWIMISVNDDIDPHFRKAEFDSACCPSDCPRPCESVCPALAIKFQKPSCDPQMNATPLDGGVIMERCYGCGRCIPVCPLGLISARTYVRPIEAVANLIMSSEVDAIEIHTGAGHSEAFKSLVAKLGSTLPSLKLVAVSLPDLGDAMIPAMAAMYASMQPFLKHLNLWQLDGRPMSGDIGAGATRAAVEFAARMVLSPDRPQGYLQLAGGTNAQTMISMKKKGLFDLSTPLKSDDKGVINSPAGPKYFQRQARGEALIAGVAFGGYARKVVSEVFQRMCGDHKGDDFQTVAHSRPLLEHYPSLLIGALQEAITLVDTVKHVKEV